MPTNNSSSSPQGGSGMKINEAITLFCLLAWIFDSVWKISCWINNSYFIYFYAFMRLISAGPYAIKPKGITVI